MIKSLVLGCGPHHERRAKTHVETLVDVREFSPGAVDVVHNLDHLPWPFENNTYDEIVAVHLVEHLDCLLSFMNECHRILAPGGFLYLVTPEAGNDPDLCYADPTHKHLYRRHSWINYMTRSEGEKFSYTDKFWALMNLEVNDGCIYLLATPIKPFVCKGCGLENGSP